MTPEMQKYIDLLESQLGYSEKGGAYTKFGDWYGKTVEFDADYSAAPWCDMYLSWAAHKLGYEDWIGQFAWTVRHAEWFKAQGAWGKTPKPGAFVFYDWSGSGSIDNIDHVGIVTKVQGDTIFTIEGNIDGGVAKRKERDTSKVVGYGYPERIKARLDEEAAQKRADEQAAMPARPGTDVGTLHLPGNSLSSLIPHADQTDHPVPHPAPKTTGNSTTTGSSTTTGGSSASTGGSSVSTGGSSTSATGDSSRTSAEAATQGGAAVASAGPTSAAGKSSATKPKHAKATTADTTSTTAEPLPTHVDASASSSLPTIASPTLVGSALVAALALLALTKTRLRPSLAAARTSRSTPRTTATGSRTPGADSPTSPATASEAEPHTTGTAGTESGSRRTGAAGTGSGPQRSGGSRSGRGSHAAPGRRRRRRPSELRGASSRSPQFLDRDEAASPTSFEPEAIVFDAAPAGVREHGALSPLDATVSGTFDPATTDAFQRVVIPVATGGFEPLIIPAATSAFEPFIERKAVDTAPFAPVFDTGPLAPIPVAGTGAGDTGEERAGISATYRGRRRRQEEPVEGFAPFEARPRGRRHRRTSGAPENPWSLDRVGGTSPVDTFIQDLPLRGRRHRGQADQDRLVGSA